MTNLSKFDAAIEQLDWAIRLFFEEKAYVPAITLAGAAAGIFEGLDQELFKKIQQHLVLKFKQFELTPKAAANHLNQARNAFKHAHPQEPDDLSEIEPELEAALMIIRAVSSYLQFDCAVPTERMMQFWQWQSETNFFGNQA